MSAYHVAQINIAQMVDAINSETMSGFVARLDEINALADGAPGFVWRLQTDDGNATSLRVFDDNMLIVNMSVWEDMDSLRNYVYKTAHAELIKMRKQWFEKLGTPHMAIWYVPAGDIPTVEEATSKLDYLEAHGPTPQAFTFARDYTIDAWLALTH
ncbi:MAG: DUF3291 domain-containing protein [Anaerolineae bacterium]|nr:DUF3291 domain-containing protein [Anaerolineae bacterium]MCA9895265.1 DUF3291 domain-containing protein [Anaerolineae bacterium]